MHTMRWIGASAIAVALVACGGGSSGGGPAPFNDQLLASYELGEGIHMGPLAPGQTLDVVMLVGHQDPQPAPAPPVVNHIDVSPAIPENAPHRRYMYAPGDNPAIDAYFARLVDGQNNDVGGGWRTTGTALGFSSDLEDIKLDNRADWLTGPDLAGANVTRLVVDVFRTGRDSQDPTLHSVQATVSIYGTR